MTTQKTLVVDLDDTICIPNHDEKDTYRKYGLAKPIPEMIEALKAARKRDYKIVISTARRMLTHRGDINKVIEDVDEITTTRLNEFEVPYAEIQYGKPYGVYYIDDKAMLPYSFIELMKD